MVQEVRATPRATAAVLQGQAAPLAVARHLISDAVMVLKLLSKGGREPCPGGRESGQPSGEAQPLNSNIRPRRRVQRRSDVCQMDVERQAMGQPRPGGGSGGGAAAARARSRRARLPGSPPPRRALAPQGLFKYHQYQVVGRHLPTAQDANPTVYRMKVWAPDAVCAKSKFW